MKSATELALIFWLLQVLVGGSATPQKIDQIRVFTREVEFDYVSWTIDTVKLKFKHAGIGIIDYLDSPAQKQIVLDYLDLVRNIQQAERQLNDIYADPNLINPDQAASNVRQSLEKFHDERVLLGPLAESILQEMITATLTELEFNLGGQPIPPVLYHSTPLPWALIVSPRSVIQQDANISLKTELTVEERIVLEDRIAADMDVSTLIVPVGGIGTYPTMIAQSTNLNWLADVIAHEWIHNFLTIQPLGSRYSEGGEIRTMNETTANIAGKEIGALLIERFFPEFVPPPPPPEDNAETPTEPTDPPAFDFRAEMQITRVTADAFLLSGQIAVAEEYMESRRSFFWEHGYRIRKLNQAYFAFHGAYADSPQGAAGEDPVGEAVRIFRTQTPSLADFVRAMAWITSLEELQGEVNGE